MWATKAHGSLHGGFQSAPFSLAPNQTHYHCNTHLHSHPHCHVRCDTLRTLSLAANEIEDDGAAELLAALSAQRRMRDDGAAEAKLSRDHAEVIAEVGITKLDLRGNRFDEKGATALALAARGANVRFQRAAPWRPSD